MLTTVVVAEYRRRITSRAFLLTTLLGPLAIVAFVGIAGAAVHWSMQSDAEHERRIGVLDATGRILPRLREGEFERFELAAAPTPLANAREAVMDGELDALVALPEDLAAPDGASVAKVYSARPLSLQLELELQGAIRAAVRRARLSRFELPSAAFDAMDAPLGFETVTVSDDGDAEGGPDPMVVGIGLSMALFMIMAIYGGLVMQTAMEEKTSRMAEVLVSSVRPFDLMMGKIVAVGALACTQVVVWMAMFAVVGTIVVQLIPLDEMTPLGAAGAAGAAGEGAAGGVSFPFRGDVAIVVVAMLPLGFLIHGSLFAALGALYETAQEAQVGTTIAMAPLVATPIIVQTARLAPESLLLTLSSLFPLSAPVVLPTRMLLGDVPVWQTVLSVALCAASAMVTIWLAGRVFRGSLLNYGRKPSFADVWRVLRAD